MYFLIGKESVHRLEEKNVNSVKQLGLGLAIAVMVATTALGGTLESVIPLGGATWGSVAPPTFTFDLTIGSLDDIYPSSDGYEFLVAPGGDQWGAFAFRAGTYRIRLLGEDAGDQDVNRVLWVDLLDLNNQNSVFTGLDGPGAFVDISPPNDWVFMLLGVPTTTALTSTQNGWGAVRKPGDNILTLAGANDRNNDPSSDNDHNDLRLSIERVAVPEPGTMVLLGSALLGLAALRQRNRR